MIILLPVKIERRRLLSPRSSVLGRPTEHARPALRTEPRSSRSPTPPAHRVLMNQHRVEPISGIVEDHLRGPQVTRTNDAAQGGSWLRRRTGEAKLPDVLFAPDHLTRLRPFDDYVVVIDGIEGRSISRLLIASINRRIPARLDSSSIATPSSDGLRQCTSSRPQWPVALSRR